MFYYYGMVKMAKITSNIVAKMGKGEDVSMDSLRKICIALDCEIGDIMEVNAVGGGK
jgi:DNA-binding Xre family transcriptional regulator